MKIKDILDKCKLNQIGGYYNQQYGYNSQFNFLPKTVLPEIITSLQDKTLSEKEKENQLIGTGINTIFGTLNGIANVKYNQNQLQRQQELNKPNYVNIPYDNRYNSMVSDYYQAYQSGGDFITHKASGLRKNDDIKDYLSKLEREENIQKIKSFYTDNIKSPNYLERFRKLYDGRINEEEIQKDLNDEAIELEKVPVERGNSYMFSPTKNKITYNLDDDEIPFTYGLVHELSHKKRNSNFNYSNKTIKDDYPDYFNLDNIRDNHDNNIEERAADLDVLRFRLKKDGIIEDVYKPLTDDDIPKIKSYLDSKDDFFLERIKRLVRPDKLKDVLNDFSYVDTKQNYVAQTGGIPERYKNMGFTKVGQKKESNREGKKWKVLAKKGDKYKVVHGGAVGMKDYTQHHDEERRKRFWDRMGGKNSPKANDPFSPLYWHKKFKTWQIAGEYDNIDTNGYKDDSPYRYEPYLDINSNRITMDNVSKPLLAITNNGDSTIMYPNEEYYFPDAEYVREIPLEEINEVGKIHINPSNKGKFTAKANAADKTVQEYASYVLNHKEDFSTKTIRQAVFAKNAKSFKHQSGGLGNLTTINSILNYHKYQTGGLDDNEVKYLQNDNDTYGQYNYIDYSDDEIQLEKESEDFWKENDLMFTLSPEIKESLNTSRRNKEINLDVPQIDNKIDYSKGSTVAQRMNSLGNMKYKPWMSSYGAEPGELAAERDGTVYAKFKNIEDSKKVHAAILRSEGYRNLSVKDGMDKYAAHTYDKNLYKELAPIINKRIGDLSDNELAFLMKTQTKFEDKNIFSKYYGK